ncbi:MAG: IclR family transcriptional regulator, partial [Mesorhizobium sp.]
MDLPANSADVEIRRASADGVAALDRAIAILDAFTTVDRSLSLAEIAGR